MERLLECCSKAEHFPTGESLIDPETNEDTLEALFEQLGRRKDVLFLENEANAALHFLETNGPTTDPIQPLWKPHCVKKFDDLKQKLHIGSTSPASDPLCRFVFVWAANSQARLYTTMKMFMLLLTYHQVLPDFLDLLSPFGLQQYPHDPYCISFRSEDRFSQAVRGMKIAELGRSGRDIRLCYSLKSAEKTSAGSVAKWSIRQTSIYHSFDVETGHSTWVIVKGDDLIKRRLEKATSSTEYKSNISSGSIDRMFASVFIVHRILCDWARENWRQYLNDLESQVQRETRHAPSVLGNDLDLIPLNGTTLRSNTYQRDESQPRGRTPQARFIGLIPTPSRLPPPPPPPPPSGPRPNGPISQPDEMPKATTVFGLKHIQMVQYVQDQAGQALLILESNANVIVDMKEYYQSIMKSKGFPDQIKEKCIGDVARFEKCAGTAERDLRLQCRRAATLRSFLEDRKAILQGIVESRQQDQAQQSAHRMELMNEKMKEMTEQMHKLAQKTQMETVSMRIITLVTLFFLPGTFIAGFMNTNILQWKPNDRTGQFQPIYAQPAMMFFLYTVGPLTVGTFIAWYAVYWWMKRQEKLRALADRAMSDMKPMPVSFGNRLLV